MNAKKTEIYKKITTRYYLLILKLMKKPVSVILKYDTLFT